jgi:cell wall-associated NlpC family hydrolase
LRARTLVALGAVTTGFACLPAAASAATGGAGVPSATKQAETATTPAQPQDLAGGAAFAPPPVRPVVTGSVAVVKNGIAYAPADAPIEVKRAIWAANQLQSKPYIYGGGHRSFRSRGYDCSGAVSYALHAAGLLDSPLDSSSFMRWGDRGRGAWITVYTNPGHAYVVIAGLRLDTSGPGERGPRWRTVKRSARGFKARHAEGF